MKPQALPQTYWIRNSKQSPEICVLTSPSGGSICLRTTALGSNFPGSTKAASIFMVKSKYSNESARLIAMDTETHPWCPPREHWTIIALIMSVWTQIQGFRERRSCIQIFALPTVSKMCSWIHSSCQCGINIPLGMSHHWTHTQWNRKLGWFLLWCAQIRLSHDGKKFRTTHQSLNLLGSPLAR